MSDPTKPEAPQPGAGIGHRFVECDHEDKADCPYTEGRCHHRSGLNSNYCALDCLKFRSAHPDSVEAAPVSAEARVIALKIAQGGAWRHRAWESDRDATWQGVLADEITVALTSYAESRVKEAQTHYNDLEVGWNRQLDELRAQVKKLTADNTSLEAARQRMTARVSRLSGSPTAIAVSSACALGIDDVALLSDPLPQAAAGVEALKDGAIKAKVEAATPGPWVVDEDDRNEQPQVTAIGGGLIALVCHECVKPRPEVEANARLIAAAPDLLAALRVVRDNVLESDRSRTTPGWMEIRDQVEMAIAKAGRQ